MLVAAMRLKQVKKQVDGHGGGERRCQSLTGLVQRVRIVTHEIRELPRVPDPKSTSARYIPAAARQHWGTRGTGREWIL
jgi:hypothetical protein